MSYYVYNNGNLYIKCMEHGQNGRRGETVLLHVGLDFRHVLVNVIILAQNMAGMVAKSVSYTHLTLPTILLV